MRSTAPRHLVDTEWLLAVSLVRSARDTKVARAFRDVLWPDLPSGRIDDAKLGRFFDLAGVARGERVSRFAAARARARQALDEAHALGLRTLSILEAEYPHRLHPLPDPPILLWTSGTTTILDRPAVAVVGSRQASPAGLEVARRLGRDLGEAGLVVVSGLARGIDGAAHEGALGGGYPTVAVLGSGLDVVYPPEHRQLAKTVVENGAVVSELLPGTLPQARNFPLRNRIISGLALAVVVVEASDRSGSLITARMGLEQGRDVLAVPGNVLSGNYRGCHALIKDGARLVESVRDVLDEIGWKAPAFEDGEAREQDQHDGLSALLPVGDPLTVDELARRTRRSVSECLAWLTAMEMAGCVVRVPGGSFVRLDGPARNRDR